MAEFASPGVISTERDFSATVQMLGTATGGTVINSKWGFADFEMIVANEDELVNLAGKPTDANYRDWFAAANFLKYSSALRWIRVIDDETALNAATGGASGILIKNKTHLDVVRSVSTLTHTFAAKCPGKLGDSIGISIADAATYSTWAYKDSFDTAPDSSGALSASNKPALDEIHVVVIDVLGLFSGVAGSVLETYPYLSKARDGKGVNGESSYYINVLNTRSNYVWALSPIPGTALVEAAPSAPTSLVGANLSDGKPFAPFTAAITAQFAGGNDGDIPGKDNYLNAFDILTSSDDTDIALLFAGGCGNDLNQPDVSNHVLTITSRRGDMVGFVSPKFSDVVGVIKTMVVKNIIATKNSLTTKDSYGVMTTGYKLQYDRYNDINRWVPGNGDDAGLCARAENLFDVWVSPAGFTRGYYIDCLDLAFNPDKNARDELYRENINPIVTFPKNGTLLYGDKTLQAKNSAFSWINIRRLFNYLRKSIQASAKYNLFDFNTSFTRQAFKDQIEPLLREIKGRNGIFDFYVRCDESNNTDAVIQKGEFLADIIIKPQYSIQGIRLSFTAVRREVSFDEVIVA